MQQTMLQAISEGLIDDVEHLLRHLRDAKQIDIFKDTNDPEKGGDLDWNFTLENRVSWGARLPLTGKVHVIITRGHWYNNRTHKVYLHCGEVTFTCEIEHPYTAASCQYTLSSSPRSSGSEESRRAAVKYWWPIFRRNCYLMGCPIECSAHEKVEWNHWYKEKARPVASQPTPAQLSLWSAQGLEPIPQYLDADTARESVWMSVLQGCSSYSDTIYLR